MGGGPPASRPRREPSDRRVVSKPGQAPPPPTGTAARPTNPTRALRPLRRPPHQWGRVANVWFGALFWCLSGPRHHPRAPEVSRVKPPSPLQAGEVRLLKPPSPLRVRNGCFWRILACSGVIGFNSGSYGLSKGDIGFMRIRLSVVGRGVGFCCGGVYVFGREKVRPARSIHPKFGIIVLAGRVFRTNRLRLSLVGDAAHFRLATMGVLRHAKPSGGVSPACRTLAWRNSPRLAAARPWFAVVWPPKCRPIG